MQVAAMADYEPRMLLKTTSDPRKACGWEATPGATRMNNLRLPRTRLDNRQRQARGHGLI